MFTLIIEDKHGGIADEYSFEEGEFYIGRSHTSDIILPSDNVSRRHARLYTVDGKCYIEDLNSSNGVFVNGRRIQEVYQIQRSAQIKVGDYYLHIESDADQGAEEEKTWCKLTGRNLSFVNQVFRVQRKVNLLGRGKDCTLTIIDPSVSRIHSKLSVERSGALTLEDLKSSNGTFVNDERIEVATVQHRDVIRIGNVEFLVEIPEQDAVAVAPKATGQRDLKRDKPERSEKSSRDNHPQTNPQTSQKSNPKTSPKGAGPGPGPKTSPKDPGPRDGGPKPTPKKPEPARDRQPAPAAAPAPMAIAAHDYSRPPQASAAPPSNTTSLADELWPDKKEGGNKLAWLVGMGTVAIIATIVLVAFKDQIFGGGEPASPTDPIATTAPPAPALPTAEDRAREEQKQKEKRQKDIEAIIAKGNEAIKEKNWSFARERFEVVLELEPLNDTARQAVNRIVAWEADKGRLEAARKLRDELKRGEAAKKLREVPDTSVYYAEAQETLRELMNSKATVELQADNDLRMKECGKAIAWLRDVQLIDPSDSAIAPKIEAIEKLLGNKARCKD